MALQRQNRIETLFNEGKQNWLAKANLTQGTN
jgi:hypothetical protein